MVELSRIQGKKPEIRIKISKWMGRECAIKQRSLPNVQVAREH